MFILVGTNRPYKRSLFHSQWNVINTFYIRSAQFRGPNIIRAWNVFSLNIKRSLIETD